MEPGRHEFPVQRSQFCFAGRLAWVLLAFQRTALPVRRSVNPIQQGGYRLHILSCIKTSAFRTQGLCVWCDIRHDVEYLLKQSELSDVPNAQVLCYNCISEHHLDDFQAITSFAPFPILHAAWNLCSRFSSQG